MLTHKAANYLKCFEVNRKVLNILFHEDLDHWRLIAKQVEKKKIEAKKKI